MMWELVVLVNFLNRKSIVSNPYNALENATKYNMFFFS